MKTVWTYISHPTVGGAHLATLGLADGLKGTDWRMEFTFSYPGPLVDECQRHGHQVSWVRMPEWHRFVPERSPGMKLRWFFSTLALFVRLLVLIRRQRPDLIFVIARREVLLCGPAALLFRVPMVFSIHGFGLGAMDLPDRLALWACRLWGAEPAFNSRHTLELARRQGWRGGTEVVYNGIDFSPDFELDRGQARREFGVGDGVVVLGAASRISPGKNFDVLLRIAAELRRLLPRPFLLLIAGAEDKVHEGRLIAELKGLAEELGVADQVRWLGHCREMGRFYRALDLFILPTAFDSFGRVFVEAMAAEVPTVGAAVGGVGEIIEHGRTGLLIPTDDPAAAAAAVADLLADPDRAATLARAGRESARSRFSLDRHVGRMLEVFERARQRKGRG